MQTRNLTSDSESPLIDLAQADTDFLSYPPQARLQWLLGCAAAGTLKGTPYLARNSDNTYGTSVIDAKHATAAWLCRALVAFGSARGLATDQERGILVAWFIEQGQYLQGMLDSQLSTLFPNRNQNDWSVRKSEAASVTMSAKRLSWSGALIPAVAWYYNNRRADMALYLALCGLEFGQQAQIDAAKRYVKEWIMFSVWETGQQGETWRDGDYGVAHQGIIYGSVNIAVALEIASRLYQVGDSELAQYTTTMGLGGTESVSPKSIRTALNWHLAIVRGSMYVNQLGACVRGPLISSYGRSLHHEYYIQPLARLGWESMEILADCASSVSGVKDSRPTYGPLCGVCGIYRRN